MTVTQRSYIIGGSALTVFVLVLVVLLRPIDDQLLGVRYELRGEIPADTNIVIVYLDNDDIRLLGGWPLQRNYYALMIDRLHEWGARVIGFDILLDSPSATAPEYDHLLLSVVDRVDKLVMIAYGRLDTMFERGLEIPDRLLYSIDVPDKQSNYEIVTPFAELTTSVSALGHSNVEGRWGDRIPVFLFSHMKAIPAFGLEVVCAYFGVNRETGLTVKKNKIELMTEDGTHRSYPLDTQYRFRVNHLGTINQFRTVRFPQLLKETEEARRLRDMIRGKLVLIGIIAEGRSTFVSSPFTETLPSAVHHATLIDNLLQQRFLRYPSVGSEFIVTLLLTFAGAITARLLPGLRGLLSVAAIAVLYIAFTIYLFNQFHYVLPLVGPVVGPLTGATVMFVLYLQSFQSKLNELEKEKCTLLEELRSREERLEELHTELQRARQTENILEEQHLLDQVKRYETEIRQLRKQIDDTEIDTAVDHESVQEYQGLLYSPGSPMRQIVEMLDKVSGTDAPVLLLGESGTGKELAARAVHARSTRRQQPFIAVNCGALPETLLESELFGHEKGAFTGAVTAKPGRFELANGGTIFLDEIAETSESFQVKLLRVLQEGTFERVGGTETKQVDVRVIAATNRNIEEALREKSFRLDLYYRLNVFSITLPPLRKRAVDIPLLAREFMKRHSTELHLSRLVLHALQAYSWPGNVRELQAVIQRASLLALSENRNIIRLHDLPPTVSESIKSDIDIADQIIEEIRSRKFSRSSVSQTAKELGSLNRGTVAEYLRGFSLQVFAANDFDVEHASRIIAGSEEELTVARARKKLREYLKNIADSIDTSVPLEHQHGKLRGKFKNLPQRYHPALRSVIEAYYNGKWKE